MWKRSPFSSLSAFDLLLQVLCFIYMTFRSYESSVSPAVSMCITLIFLSAVHLVQYLYVLAFSFRRVYFFKKKDRHHLMARKKRQFDCFFFSWSKMKFAFVTKFVDENNLNFKLSRQFCKQLVLSQ